MSLRRALIVPDCHIPFHNRRAYALMLSVASFASVDEIVLLGDFADFYSVSRHSKDPRVTKLISDEVASVNAALDEFDRLFPKAKKFYLEGNHEKRLESLLADKAPGLFGVTECINLFQIPARPLWRYLPYQKMQSHRVLGSELRARHTPLAGSAKTGLQRAFVSYCYGHNHKIEEAQCRGLDGQTRVAFSCGWLGDERSLVFDYMATPPQWQLGFALVSTHGSSKEFHHEIVKIKSDYSCFALGKRFKE